MNPDNMQLPDLGIELTSDTRLRIDWQQVSDGIAQTVSDVIFKAWADGGASAVTSAVKALNSSRLEHTPGNRAYNLILLSFGWAIGQVVNQYNVERPYVSECLRTAIGFAHEEIKKNGNGIGPDFLKNPLSSDLYQYLKREMVRLLMLVLTQRSYKSSVLDAKIDIAFVRALYDVWADSPANYSELSSILQSPFADAGEAVLGWQSYRKSLICDFEVKPVFGQELEGITLSQLYVPIRAFWALKNELEGRLSHNHAGGADTKVVMLDEEIDSWLENDSESDWLRLVGGGPGSGKSTSLKSLAARYAKRDDWRPLFIPLQHIGIDGDLRAKINAYFVDRSGGSFKQAPLSRSSVESGSPLLLIFDGLDELSAPNESANDTVQTFTGKLTSLYNALVGDSQANIKIVVSGRLPSFQAAKRFLPIKEDGAVEIYGYSPASSASQHDLWGIDQRPIWWSQYAAAKGIDTQVVPEALTATVLEGISHEPLLCYLLALSNYTGDNWKEAADNTNLIYKALIKSVYERGWGDGPQKRLGPGKSMTFPEFDKLMQTFGLAAWLGGDARVASESSFKATLSVTRGQNSWDSFQRDNGSDMNNLAMNFYLKSSELSHRGFEFTHKSFGEYLAAKAIVEFAFSIYDLADRSLDGALQEWFKATKTGVVGYEILRHVKNEIRLFPEREIEKLRKVKKSFEKIASVLNAEGFISTGQTNYRSSEFSHNNAELSAWCILHGLVWRINEIVDTPEYINIEWSGQYDLGRLIERRASYDVFSMAASDYFSYVNGRSQSIVAVSGYTIDFFGADLADVNFESCSFGDVDFTRANLNGAAFYTCHITSGNFSEAAMKDVVFSDCVLDECSFSDVSCERVRADFNTLMRSTDLPGLSDASLLVEVSHRADGTIKTWADASKRMNTHLEKIAKLKTYERARTVAKAE